VGALILPADGRVHIDANILIYRVEALEPYAKASLPLWEALHRGDCEVITSALTLLEVLVRPLRERNDAIAMIFRDLLLDTAGFVCVPIDRDILELAATLRAEHRLKTPDAIHAATALRSGASMFLTNDQGFTRVAGLNAVILGEIIDHPDGSDSRTDVPDPHEAGGS